MAESYRISSGDSVSVLITTSNEESCIPLEKNLKKSMTVMDLKHQLEFLTGAGRDTMSVKVFDGDNYLFPLDNDNALIGSYQLNSGMRLHIEDAFALKKALEDDSNVEKYVMPPEEYNKRDDTLKAYLEKNKLGKYNPEETAKREAEKKREEEAEEKAAKSINVGDRCEVSVPGNPTRRAEVMFVGKTQFKPGWWVGVKYDEPMGKNDGSINGVKYFECLPKYGGFIKPMHIKVGDFPEESLDLDDEL